MTSYRKNILVGVTVLGGLVALVWMILKFGDRPAKLFADAQMPVNFATDRADGVAEGSAVLFRGVQVGRVISVERSADGMRVLIHGEVDEEPPLPANVVARIRAQSLLGAGSALVLELTGPKPEGVLANGQTVVTHFVGLDLIPPEFADLARELRAITVQLREADFASHLDQAVISLRTQIDHAGKMIDSMQELVGDEKVRGDLKQTVASLRTATESANRITQNIEKFSVNLDQLSKDANGTVAEARVTIGKADVHMEKLAEQMGGRLEQVAKVLDSFQSITAKIDKGDGTAGQLVNDPRLYESLVDSSRELTATITDLKRLVEQWEQEGVSLKLAK